jgi:hypothetical protein
MSTSNGKTIHEIEQINEKENDHCHGIFVSLTSSNSIGTDGLEQWQDSYDMYWSKKIEFVTIESSCDSRTSLRSETSTDMLDNLQKKVACRCFSIRRQMINCRVFIFPMR